MGWGHTSTTRNKSSQQSRENLHVYNFQIYLYISERMKLAVPNLPLVVNFTTKQFEDILVRAILKLGLQVHRGTH